MSVVLGKPGLDYSKPHLFQGGSAPTGVTAAKLDSGKSVDLAIADHNSDRVRVLLNRG